MADSFKIHLFTAESSDLQRLSDEALWLNSLLRAGLDILHLRKPRLSREATEQLILSIESRFHPRIVLHDFPQLALRYGCGFQFNTRNPYDSETSAALPLRSLSCHSLDQCKPLSDMDFITLSPIFDSISKAGYKGALDRSELQHADLSRVVALGGVSLDKIPLLKDLGFGGAALLGDIWNRKDGPALLLKYLRMRNLPLQFITHGKDIRQTLLQARDVIRGGGRWIQVRMKDSDLGEIRETLQELLPACEENGVTLLVDDHLSLAGLCHGVHLGQEDTPVAEARSLLPPEMIIGLTVNNLTQIHHSLSSLPDYYGVGPFRTTLTKRRLAPVLGLDGYRRLAPELCRPFVAIGGIRPDDIPSLIKAGADGIALSSCITEAADPVLQTKLILSRIYGK